MIFSRLLVSVWLLLSDCLEEQAGEPNGAGVGGRVGRSGLLVGLLRSNGPLLLGGCKTLIRMKMWLNEDGSVIVPGSLSLWCHFPAGHLPALGREHGGQCR